MIKIADCFRQVVLQPTTLCNLDCGYCYLPMRKVNKRMSVEIAESIARSIEEQGLDRPVEVLWHGGEPLACGIGHFKKLLEPFDHLRQLGKVFHVIQTNATLIDEAWCSLFLANGFRVGISVDGPAGITDQRVDLRGSSAHARILDGIKCLKGTGIPFTTIAVVNSSNISHPRELYQFFCGLGCRGVGFNIEELEGVNQSPDRPTGYAVQAFWKGLLDAWSENPRIQVREINRVLSFARAVLDSQGDNGDLMEIPPFPTITWEGDVVLLSPELAGSKSERYRNFVAGNVLKASLVQIVRSSIDNHYVEDFVRGVKRCQATCSYFNFCRGGQASNKFQECDTIDATETEHCRNTKQRLFDAVVP